MSFAGRGSISATDSAVEQLCRCVVSSDLENLTNSLLYVHLFAIQLHAYNCSNQGVRLLRVLMCARPWLRYGVGVYENMGGGRLVVNRERR